MTFAKFQRDVMPDALRIEVSVPPTGDFCAFTTAADMDAPPIIRWDSADYRNPVGWYVYHKGSRASQWGLTAGDWHEVVAVSAMPCMWAGMRPEVKELGQSALLIIKGARDSQNKSLALFPELLRGDLHSVRSTIEAHSQASRLELPTNWQTAQYACGLRAGSHKASLRVTFEEGMIARYDVDRWE